MVDHSSKILFKTVLVIGGRDLEKQGIFTVLEQQQFRPLCVNTVEEAEPCLRSAECAVVIMDLDTIPVSNQVIRNLAKLNPQVPFLCASNQRFHPELQEAFHNHIYACLAKPVDPDELRYWIKSIRDNERYFRAPP